MTVIEVVNMAERHKRVTYIVKDDAMDAINDVHTGR